MASLAVPDARAAATGAAEETCYSAIPDWKQTMLGSVTNWLFYFLCKRSREFSNRKTPDPNDFSKSRKDAHQANRSVKHLTVVYSTNMEILQVASNLDKEIIPYGVVLPCQVARVSLQTSHDC